MLRYWSLFVAVIVVVAGSNAPAVAADGNAVSATSAAELDTGLIQGAPVFAGGTGDLSSCPDCPKLYNNTDICTITTQALPVGGKTPDGMALRDYFLTNGGTLSGFDIFVMNGKTEILNHGGTLEQLDQPLQMQFYTGTDTRFLGDSLGPAGLFRTLGGPSISKIPVWFDPNTTTCSDDGLACDQNDAGACDGDPSLCTGVAGLIRVSVDYINQTYNLVGLYEDPPGSGNTVEEQLNPLNQFLGTSPGRLPITLPAGKIGLDVKLSGEFSICNQGDPKAGFVLAGGGPGNEDGLHVIAEHGDSPASLCIPNEWPLICNGADWTPFETFACPEGDADCVAVFGAGALCDEGLCVDTFPQPCGGGDVCNFDRPFNGLALVLYVGPNSDELADENGNNDIAAADMLAAPAAGTGEITKITGFVGDNGTPIGAGTSFPAYDHGEPGDGDVDLLDWRHLQICFGRTDFDVPGEPSCAVHDRDNDDVIDVDEFDGFSDCFTGDVSDPNFTANDPLLCSGEIPPPPLLLQDVDIYRINGVNAGDVVAIRVEGSKSGSFSPLWDPYLRVFDGSGDQIPFANGEGGESDDFEPSSLDAFTTVVVPAGSSSIFAGISTSGQIQELTAPTCSTGADCVAAGVTGTCAGGDNDGLDCNFDSQCPGCDDGKGGFIDCPCQGSCGVAVEGVCDLLCTDDADCASIFGAGATCGRMEPGECDLRLWYDPTDASTIPVIGAGADAGAYTMSIARTDPNAVTDSHSAGGFTCYVTRHEPDDTMAQADLIGPINNNGNPGPIVGAIGDGPFSRLGQDIDIYRIELDGDPLLQTTNTQSISVSVSGITGGGYQTVLDLSLALYNSDGELIATGDQASRQGGFDQTRPQLGANVCGSASPFPEPGEEGCQNRSTVPGLYYLAIFGTDRAAWDEDGDALRTPPPPSLLNFPHGPDVAATQNSDLRPVVGGRVNLPGPALDGREAPSPNTFPNGEFIDLGGNTGGDPGDPRLQCYRIAISTCPNGSPFCAGQPLPQTGQSDVDEQAGANGNDSIPNASSTVAAADRLSNIDSQSGNSMNQVRVLGNGHFGGFQGDVDFYEVSASPGDIVSLNIADNVQPPGNSNNITRSHVALYDADGFIFADHAYSLERYDPNVFITDQTSDELAANVTGVVPTQTGAGNSISTVYAMVGIDNGNLEISENTPFDAAFAGTTLSRRFETNTLRARPYDVGIAVLSPLSASVQERVFVIARRGLDGQHTEPFVDNPPDADRASYPPILELDPNSGSVIGVLEPSSSFYAVFRRTSIACGLPDGCPPAVSAKPAIAYDGSHIFLTVEKCVDTNCATLTHPFFKLDPTLPSDAPGFVLPITGNIADLNGNAVITGMVEINGYLYALDSHSEAVPGEDDLVINVLRFWDKDVVPNATVGGTSSDLVLLSGTDIDETDFDDVDGDIGTDGTNLFVGCSLMGESVGVCEFGIDLAPDGQSVALTFLGTREDPITNDELIPGPRLGGIDFLSSGNMMVSDSNGTIIEYMNASGDVEVVELPREFLIERITARMPAP